MRLLGTLMIVVVALLHIGFAWLEMIAWTKPIGLSVFDMTAEEAAIFFKDNNIDNLPSWHDASFGLSAALLLPGLPTSVFYDKRGREIARVSGEADWTSDEALALIDELTGP